MRQASPHFECHFVLWPLHVRQAEEVGIKPTLKMLKLGFMYSKIAQDLFFPGNMWVFFSCTTLSVRAVQASLDLTSLRNEKILTKTGSSAILAVIETMQLGSEHECPIKRSIPSRQHSEFTKRRRRSRKGMEYQKGYQKTRETCRKQEQSFKLTR